jgi:TM2 domain-containing membrane protein YozV
MTEQYPQYAPQVRPKNPGLALIASLLIPGLGQLVTGRVWMGILIFSLFVLSLLLLFVVIGFVTLPLVWLWAMVDAYHGARKWNTAHGIIS